MIFFMLLLILTFQVNASELCENEVGENTLEIISIQDSKLLDEIEWIWEPNEEKTIEVEVENKNYTKRNFKIELFLLDGSYNIRENFTTSSSDVIKTVSIDNGETYETEFSFQLNGVKGGLYFLYAKLYDENNESICTELKAIETGNEALLEIEEEMRMSMVKRIYGPTLLTTGEEVEYTLEIINLGNIEEDKVLITAYNKELNIREEAEITTLGIQEIKNITLNFTIPQNTTSTQEQIIFSTEYDYNKNSGLYSEIYDRDKTLTLQIITAAETTNKTDLETAPQEQTNTTPQIAKPEVPEKESSLLWVIITIVIILLIATAILIVYFHSKKNNIIPATTTTQNNEVNDYLSKMKKTTPETTTSPDKLS